METNPSNARARNVAAALVFPLIGAIAIACGDTSNTANTASASASASGAPSTRASVSKPPSPPTTPTAVASLPAPTKPPKKRPKGWKEEWHPAPDEGDDSVFALSGGNPISRKDVPDPRTCPIDGPLWTGTVSFYGAACSDTDLSGCAEVAERLYETGHWACAKAFHALLCYEAPNLTAPPASSASPKASPSASSKASPSAAPKASPSASAPADYPMLGYPSCPPENDPRMPWADEQLKDKTTNDCFIRHDASACMALAAKEKDPLRRQRLGQLAAAWE